MSDISSILKEGEKIKKRIKLLRVEIEGLTGGGSGYVLRHQRFGESDDEYKKYKRAYKRARRVFDATHKTKKSA